MFLPSRLAAQLCGLLALLSASFTARATDATASATERKPPAITVSTLGSPLPSCGNVTDPEALTERALQYWSQKIERVLPNKPDLILLPETCDTPSGLPKEALRAYYHFRGNKIRDFLGEIAKKHRCYIAYPSYQLLADGSLRNTCQLLDRSGIPVGSYHKNHPTAPELDLGVLCGADAPVFECDFGRVAIAICFDLNFETIRSRYASQHPDLILFPSMYHGGLMQSVWAYTCRAHFVGSIAGHGAPSEIRDPTGRVLASTTNYTDHATALVHLDCALVHLDFHSEKLRRLKQQYGTQIDVFDPGLLGSVLLTSKSADLPLTRVLAEFEIQKLDAYLRQSLDTQAQPKHRESIP
jgi:predicted amidohydrolase